jgi:signal recognition particle GTPase
LCVFGQGKTTTVAAIVAALVRQGRRVLVTAYTNSAVDSVRPF